MAVILLLGAALKSLGRAIAPIGELIRAMRNGATYVNVHSTGRPGGEIRAQLSGVTGHRH